MYLNGQTLNCEITEPSYSKLYRKSICGQYLAQHYFTAGWYIMYHVTHLGNSSGKWKTQYDSRNEDAVNMVNLFSYKKLTNGIGSPYYKLTPQKSGHIKL